MRLDVYLTTYYPEITRSQIQLLIKHGRATINGVPELKPSTTLGEDDAVLLDTRPLNINAPDLTNLIKVLYEDEDIAVIDKPEGLLTHSKGSFNPEKTVASWLASRSGFKFSKLQTNRDGIAHRLDRSTSGIMVCAKNQTALTSLQKQFQNRSVTKTYTAIVKGKLNKKEALIDLPIERNPKQPQRFRVGAGGKSAQTHYKVLIEKNNTSQLELKPKTGRTHQLRVHLEHIGHPILGDDFYNGPQADRLYLHAHKLSFKKLNGDQADYVAEIPDAFKKYI